MKRRLFEAEVVECREKSNDVFNLSLLIDQPLEAEPGQFVALESRCGSKIWRRPFSVYDQLKDGRDFSICFKAVGENTRYYASLTPGQKISVLGPLGNPIVIKESVERYILVAGGIGMAGLMFLDETLVGCGKNVVFLYGTKSDADVVDAYRLNISRQRVRIVTEDENHLQATDLLCGEISENIYNPANTEIVACGPLPMLKKVSEIAAGYQVKCRVLMETLMACGVGSCKGCAIPKIGGGYFHLCQDGPALPGNEVDWEKLERPSKIELVERRLPVEQINMKVTLVGQNGLNLVLPSPIVLDSGTFEATAATYGPADLTHVGAVSSKGTTILPKAGNLWPRVCETPSGMMNSIGLENPGLKVFLEEKLPGLNRLDKTVIVNISGETAKEFAVMAEQLAWVGAKAICLNISCPNKEKGGRIFSLVTEDTREVVRQVVSAVGGEMFIFVKLSPMAPDAVAVAKAAEEAGADALWLFNTFLGLKIDLITRRPSIGNVYGGLSGPAMKPLALRLLHLVSQSVKIPVVGGTGIENGNDAAEYLIAGAQAVAVGTAILHNPNVGTEIFHGLREVVAGYGMSDIKELVGSLIL